MGCEWMKWKRCVAGCDTGEGLREALRLLLRTRIWISSGRALCAHRSIFIYSTLKLITIGDFEMGDWGLWVCFIFDTYMYLLLFIICLTGCSPNSLLLYFLLALNWNFINVKSSKIRWFYTNFTFLLRTNLDSDLNTINLTWYILTLLVYTIKCTGLYVKW